MLSLLFMGTREHTSMPKVVIWSYTTTVYQNRTYSAVGTNTIGYQNLPEMRLLQGCHWLINFEKWTPSTDDLCRYQLCFRVVGAFPDRQPWCRRRRYVEHVNRLPTHSPSFSCCWWSNIKGWSCPARWVSIHGSCKYPGGGVDRVTWATDICVYHTSTFPGGELSWPQYSINVPTHWGQLKLMCLIILSGYPQVGGLEPPLFTLGIRRRKSWQLDQGTGLRYIISSTNLCQPVNQV
jgi:hypothetical protein